MSSGRWLSIFWRNTLLSSSKLKYVVKMHLSDTAQGPVIVYVNTEISFRIKKGKICTYLNDNQFLIKTYGLNICRKLTLQHSAL
jgi:hypothetical protein